MGAGSNTKGDWKNLIVEEVKPFVYNAQLKCDTCKFLIINYTSHHLMYNTGIVYITNYINHPRYCNIVRGVRRKGHVPKPVVCLGGHFRNQNKKIHFYVEWYLRTG